MPRLPHDGLQIVVRLPPDLVELGLEQPAADDPDVVSPQPPPRGALQLVAQYLSRPGGSSPWSCAQLLEAVRAVLGEEGEAQPG